MTTDSTPLSAHDILINSIVNLLLMANETGDADANECLSILAAAPKAYVIRMQDEWEENAAIAVPIPHRTGQYDGEESAMSA